MPISQALSILSLPVTLLRCFIYMFSLYPLCWRDKFFRGIMEEAISNGGGVPNAIVGLVMLGIIMDTNCSDVPKMTRFKAFYGQYLPILFERNHYSHKYISTWRTLP